MPKWAISPASARKVAIWKSRVAIAMMFQPLAAQPLRSPLASIHLCSFSVAQLGTAASLVQAPVLQMTVAREKRPKGAP